MDEESLSVGSMVIGGKRRNRALYVALPVPSALCPWAQLCGREEGAAGSPRESASVSPFGNVSSRGQVPVSEQSYHNGLVGAFFPRPAGRAPRSGRQRARRARLAWESRCSAPERQGRPRGLCPGAPVLVPAQLPHPGLAAAGRWGLRSGLLRVGAPLPLPAPQIRPFSGSHRSRNLGSGHRSTRSSACLSHPEREVDHPPEEPAAAPEVTSQPWMDHIPGPGETVQEEIQIVIIHLWGTTQTYADGLHMLREGCGGHSLSSVVTTRCCIHFREDYSTRSS
ncbi:PREDICTED: uncharacterized protein LOC106148988 [Chinchilla lanigera]|uniref:uncharacterized protein LOC106148988 n=1 Tax=Chinchilla lanigera TaxID=34839 RepID=UPI00069865CE|nr:PREDICTED: uncharacterized protein LOC106148988 [Chinchilla lanigera]